MSVRVSERAFAITNFIWGIMLMVSIIGTLFTSKPGMFFSTPFFAGGWLKCAAVGFIMYFFMFTSAYMMLVAIDTFKK